MSGHSHYATIKRQKESKDSAKGKTFSKMARAIALAARGGVNPESNYKLRMAMEQAKAVNMPKANIERILKSATDEGRGLEEVKYEGYGPFGVAVVVEVVTDNKNRTGAEIKNIFERGGGSLAGPGAVSFNFEPRGLFIINKDKDVDSQMLKLIDIGASEIEETEDALEVYTNVEDLSQVGKKLKDQGYGIESQDMILKAKNYVLLEDANKARKSLDFLETLESCEDVQSVFANLDIPQNIANELKN